MTTQSELDFKPIVHEFENNPESQALLDSIRPLLTSQVHRVLWFLARGFKLNTSQALEGLTWRGEVLKIGDLRARIYDIRKNMKLIVKSDMINHYKNFWLPETERIKAMRILTGLKNKTL